MCPYMCQVQRDYEVVEMAPAWLRPGMMMCVRVYR